MAQGAVEGILWGAGLDVYEREPVMEEELLGLKNAVLLPHLGRASEETRERMSGMAVESVDLVLGGRIPKTWLTRRYFELNKKLSPLRHKEFSSQNSEGDKNSAL